MSNGKYEKELRIGLVLYGGVSLAIYIYGVVYEFLRLAREEGAYAELTKSAGVKPVIDVISGSSAGGINGLFLAKALTTGSMLDPLKELWIQQGDLEILVNADDENPRSLLNSAYYERQLRDALDQIKPDPLNPTNKGMSGLLDVFITATNLDGIITEYGKPFFRSPIQTKHYGTVFHFKSRPDHYGLTDLVALNREALSSKNQAYLDELIEMLDQDRRPKNDFDDEASPASKQDLTKNYYLARIAASTSAFPVAFTPVPFKRGELSEMRQVFGSEIVQGDTSSLGFRQDETSQSVIYGDGGMVNNKPFSHAMKTIFRRQANGPVDRKLFFIDPDPVTFDDSNRLGDQDGVDGFHSLQGFLEAIFYESISKDLETLVDQNFRILNIQQILLDFEAELASYLKNLGDKNRTPEQVREMYRAQPVYGTYGQIKITAIRHELETRLFEKADLDQLIAAIEQNSPEELAGKNRAEREIFVQNRLKALLNEVIHEKYHTLQTEEDRSAFLRRFDHFFRIRRLRYFINKLNVWLAEIEVMPEIDRTSAEVIQLVETLGSLKGKIYTFIEFYSHGAWQIWAQAPVINQESVLRNTFGYVENRFDRLMDSGFKHLAFDMIGLELAQVVKKIQSLRPVQPYMPTPDNDEYYELQRTTAHLENMLTQCGDDEFTQCMERVFNTYEFLDMYLYPASILANIGEADPIEVIRVSPKDAIRYKDTVAGKLAGEKLMHFSAFLKRSWRENDLLWGRLDAAEIIVKTILADDEKTANQVLDKLCPNIISEELTSIRDRRDVELTKALFDDRDQEQIRQILLERTALGDTQESENFLTQFYDTGMQGFESVAQNYLLRTSAKSLRTISRMFELRSAQNRKSGSLLDRPMRYLTILLNLPYIFLVTLGGAEESRRKRLINLAFIVGAILMVLHLIGGLSLRSELLLGLIALLLIYLRPHRLLGIALFILAALILLLTAGILRINVELQNPIPITDWLNLLFSSN